MIRAFSLAAAALVAALAVSSLGAAQEQPPPRITPLLDPSGPPVQLDFQDRFPERALRACRNGQVDIACTVRANGNVDCEVTRERPRGWGFGEATLHAARRLKVAPDTIDGTPTDTRRFETRFIWETSRRPSERPNGCSERDPTEAYQECVVRVTCQREPELPPFG